MPTTDITVTLDRLQRIERSKDQLIDSAVTFLNGRGNDRNIVVPVDRNQLQNLLRLALSTTSVKEIKLFIRYQCGRDKANQGWNNRNFGSSLSDRITQVAQEAGDNESLKIELVRLFLGYLIREARYRKPE
jgi:hypothetical protein